MGLVLYRSKIRQSFRVKIVLKEKGSGLFFGKTGWTAFLEEALDFGKMSAAAQCARDRALNDVAVFLELFGKRHSVLLADLDAVATPEHTPEEIPARKWKTVREG